MASTVIGAGITIEGEVTADEDVVVQGTIRGKLSAKDGVTVEAGAVIEADITGGPMAVAVRHGQHRLDRSRRSPGGRTRHRQREGHPDHHRGRRPVQGQTSTWTS